MTLDYLQFYFVDLAENASVSVSVSVSVNANENAKNHSDESADAHFDWVDFEG
jgi:hypothetical protein